MANFVAIIDEDAERRRRFIRQIRPELALVDCLHLDEIEAGDFATVWAAQPRTPISRIRSPTAAAIIWGDAIPANGAQRADAGALFEAWAPRAIPPPAFDGFYAALRFDARHGLVVGADVLGLFPVYYAWRDGVLLLGSSPRVFRSHPCFRLQLSRAGLAGILLTHAPLGGRTLLEDVHRLAPGHALTWSKGAALAEVRQYAIRTPTSEEWSFTHTVEALDDALAGSIARHLLGNTEAGMLLSGGRDSRLIAGYVTEHTHRVHALTLGTETDYEMRCATEVARVLDCPHATVDLDEAHFPDFASLQAEWEQLGTGFANVHMWGAVAPLRELPARVFAGHNLEIRSSEPMPDAFDQLFAGVKNRGFQPATLRRLLRPEVFDDVVNTLEQERRSEYEAGSSTAEHRPARFFLAHDRRAHAGGVPWKLSFGAWPILPILDRALLDTIFALPASALANRRAQDEILRHRFRHLARLPLDRNARHILPLLPSPAQRVTHLIGRATDPITRRFPGRRERRYYHRIYDVNGPGWRAIRRLAEPHREWVSQLFNMDVLAELVPQPDAPLPVRDTITGSFAPKLLIGFMIWSAHHLS